MSEAAGGSGTDSSINESSDWVNRIDYIPHIYSVQVLVCEIPNITMNFRRAGVWDHQPNLPRSSWKRWLRTKKRPTNVQERFKSRWMTRRFLIQIIPVQYWALFSTQATTNLNMSILMRGSGCGLPIWFAIQPTTLFQGRRIQFQACPEWSFGCTCSGPYGSLWGDGYGILICQKRWWRMKCGLARI